MAQFRLTSDSSGLFSFGHRVRDLVSNALRRSAVRQVLAFVLVMSVVLAALVKLHIGYREMVEIAVYAFLFAIFVFRPVMLIILLLSMDLFLVEFLHFSLNIPVINISASKIIGAVLIVATLVDLAVKRRKANWGERRIGYLLILFLFVYILSSITAVDRILALTFLFRFVQCLIFYFVLINLVTDTRKFVILTSFFIGFVTINAFFAIMQAVRHHQLRVIGYLLNPNLLALNSLAALTFCLCLITVVKRRWVKNALIFAIFLFVVTVILTQSRAPIFGMGILFIVLFIFYRKKSFLITLLIVTILALSYLIPMGYTQRVSSYVEKMRAGEIFETSRQNLIKAGWQMFLDHPILGVGPGNFYYLYGAKYGPEVVQDYRKRASHNSYMTYLSENGILGFLLFIMILIAIFYDLIKNRKTIVASRDVVLLRISDALILNIFLICIVGFFHHALFKRMSFYYIGMAYAAIHIARNLVASRSSGADSLAEPQEPQRSLPDRTLKTP